MLVSVADGQLAGTWWRRSRAWMSWRKVREHLRHAPDGTVGAEHRVLVERRRREADGGDPTALTLLEGGHLGVRRTCTSTRPWSRRSGAQAARMIR